MSGAAASGAGADQSRTVHARLVFPATGSEHRLAKVRVRLEDVSRADAAAQIVGEAERSDIVVPADGLSLDIPVEPTVAADARRRFVVRAHGSASGAEKFAAGDFLTTSGLPTTLEPSGPVEAPLRYLG